jgi:hypothetical protein
MEAEMNTQGRGVIVRSFSIRPERVNVFDEAYIHFFNRKKGKTSRSDFIWWLVERYARQNAVRLSA